jgi:hypothetical protein
MKFLHFTTDEKFINGAMSTFELAFPSQNRLYLLKAPANPKTRYVHQKYITQEIVKNSQVLDFYKRIAKNADWVIIHGMNDVWAEFILKNKNIKILYVIWGAEIYGNRYLYAKNILGEKTKNLLENNSKFSLKDFLKMKFNSFRYGKSKSKEEVQLLNKQAIQKIENIAILYKEEIEGFYKNEILIKPINYLKFGYYPFEYFMDQVDSKVKLGNNILIGNSSSYSNNHLEVFEHIKTFDLEDKKLIVPLSYGDPVLSKQLLSKGQSLLKDNFYPILDFMPLSAYTKLMQTCNVVIMNHYRQQAVGNIISAVYLGAKVFLNKENSAYLYLKGLGCHIYEITEDLNSHNDLLGLTDIEINHNRSILQNDINQSKLVKNLKTFLN